MRTPTVCAICLTKDRPEMLARAVRSFQAQTYENKRLLIVNSGPCPLVEETDDIWEPCFVGIDALTVGALRNHACKFASAHYAESWTRPEIFIHWDDDDVSHQNRIAEQVALLQSSGADVVGYSNLLFWRNSWVCARAQQKSTDRLGLDVCGNPTLFHEDPTGLTPNIGIGRAYFTGEAWLYLGPQKAVGTSLCYWRKTWERKPFPDQPRPGFAAGEDRDWIQNANLASVPSCPILPDNSQEPRLIASIHGGNTSGAYKLIGNSTSWRRVPEYDSVCREAMAL